MNSEFPVFAQITSDFQKKKHLSNRGNCVGKLNTKGKYKMNLEYYKLFQGIDQICKIENQPISFHSNSLSKLNTRIANKQVSASWFTSLYRNK
jgi:hypothetical protein